MTSSGPHPSQFGPTPYFIAPIVASKPVPKVPLRIAGILSGASAGLAALIFLMIRYSLLFVEPNQAAYAMNLRHASVVVALAAFTGMATAAAAIVRSEHGKRRGWWDAALIALVLGAALAVLVSCHYGWDATTTPVYS